MSGITVAADPAMLGDRPLEEVFSIVAEAGYRALELSPRRDFLPGFAGRRISAQTVESVARSAASSGLEIASLMVVYNWASPDETERQAAVRYWRQAIAVAADLGCTRLNSEFSGDPRRSRESEASFWRSMDELIPALEQARVRLFIEPHPYDFIETGREAVRLLAGIDSVHLGYIFCAPHTFSLGGTIAEQIAEGGRLLGHVHVADTFNPTRVIVNPPGTDVRTHLHLDLGQGEIEWSTVFEALAKVAFQGVLTVSVFAWPERAGHSLRVNLEAVERLAIGAGLQLTGRS